MWSDPDHAATAFVAEMTNAAVNNLQRIFPGLVRWLLFLFAVLLACPIRYWAVTSEFDNTWVFALNYAAAHGLAIGRDVVWTAGPLGYLVFPQDIGHNLAHALIFQSIVWTVLIAILADLFFRAGFKLPNLALFTLFFAMSAPLYWFNYTGLENLLLMGALVLLVVERSRGGAARYLIALALIGVIPPIKLTGALIAGGARAGWLTDRWIRLRARAWLPAALVATVPTGVFAFVCWCTLPSWDAFARYVRASFELAENYSVAMSLPGHWYEWIAAAVVLVAIAVALLVTARSNRQHAMFCAPLLAIPLFAAVKYGFVRQNMHVLNFFCFAGLALGLIALGAPLAGKSLGLLGLVLIAYAGSAMPAVHARIGEGLIQDVTGIQNVWFIRDAFSLGRLRASLRASSLKSFDPKDRLDLVVRGIIQDSPVASLSSTYSDAALDGLNLTVYPVVQKYAAYTPYLDGLNAEWIRDRGPRFLIVEWAAIDSRHPWVETPATWAEIYRWYDTRALEGWSVLLLRRASPRFERFELVRRAKIPFRGSLDMPESSGAIFWTMKCRPNFTGTLRKLLFRVPEIRMSLDETVGDHEDFRIVPEVLSSRVMGNYLPNSKEDLAALLDPAAVPEKLVDRLTFSGPGIGSYGDTCEVEFYRTR